MKNPEDTTKPKAETYNVIERFAQFIDTNHRFIMYGFYGVTAIGGVIAVRSLKITKQFKHIKEIPEEYFSKNFSLFGIVEKTRTKLILSENYPTINFSHIPIYGKPARDDNSSLKIRIAGVKIDPAFINQAEVYLNRFENSKVKVRLLDKCESVLVGQVLSKEFFLWRKCLGSYLLRNGFGYYDNDCLKKSIFNKEQQRYKNSLMKHEAYAKKHSLGVWEEENYEKPSSLLRIVKKIFKLN